MTDLIGSMRDHAFSVYCSDDEAARLLKEAADALEAAREDVWLPIETAPKDGAYVLLTDANHPICHLIGKWNGVRWWGQATQSGRSIVWNAATHWRPLPAPPAIDSARKEVGDE